MFGLILAVVIAGPSAYFFRRLTSAFRDLRWRKWPIVGVLALLAAGRFVGRGLASLGLTEVGEAIWPLMVVWMIVLFWFLCGGLAVDIWNTLMWGFGRLVPRVHRWRIPPRPAFGILCALIAMAGAWGWAEAGSIGVTAVAAEIDYLPDGRRGLRIVQIADLHLGSPRSGRSLAKTVELIRQLEPDIIVSTGDLVDGDLRRIRHLAQQLRELDAPLGKYAVLGNHEFYAGAAGSTAFHEAAGFRVLRQEAVFPVKGLRIAGVDDPAGRRWGDGGRDDETPLLAASSAREATILLKHQPTVNPSAVGRFDVQLSGHTHGGQVFPFIWLTRLVYDYGSGVHHLEAGSTLVVSRGTGAWGAPLRVGAPPEIIVIDLTTPERPQAASR